MGVRMHRSVWLLAVLALGAGGQAFSAVDCELGNRYLALAQDRQAAFEQDEAAEYLRRAIEVCPSYAAHQQLGEIAAQSTEGADKQLAVQSFVAAHQLATTRETRSRSLYQYAKLLSREGDPQNAYPLIKDAELLTPADPDVQALARSIQAQIDNPTPEQIVRGLRDTLYRPLVVASASGLGVGGGAAVRPTRPVAAPPSGPSVNIPINFVTGSTRVDEETRSNVVSLARALADPSLDGGRFLFVGHADIRGDDLRNLELSRQRAEALSQAVIVLEPALEGRIDFTGRGSAEPLDAGDSERAWRANRRLQVLLQ